MLAGLLPLYIPCFCDTSIVICGAQSHEWCAGRQQAIALQLP